jgi:hypothetical protein
MEDAMTDRIGLQRLYWELALMGLEWETAVKLVIRTQIGDGYPVPVPGTSSTVRRHSEGYAAEHRYVIEEAEPVTITWSMQADEWDELRNYLISRVPDAPILRKLNKNGGLAGTTSTLTASTAQVTREPTAVKHHTAKPLDGTSDLWRCACGTTFHNDHGWAICPNTPGRCRPPSGDG